MRISPTRECPRCGEAYVAHGGRKVCHPCRVAEGTPEERRAKNKIYSSVTRAIRVGELVRQPCEVCGETKVDAHHDDYSKPLDVRWLCRSHHRQHHKQHAI